MNPTCPAEISPVAGVNPQRRGFTLVELVVVVVIMGVLGALLLSSIARAKEKGKRITCVNNLRQIGQAMILYGGDNDDRIPPGETSSNFYGISSQPFHKGFGCLMNHYLAPATTDSGPGIWRCPSQTDGFFLEETSLPGWTPASDQARWRGCYSYAFRTRNRTTGAIDNPAYGSWGAGPWPGVRLNDGNYAYAFDHCTSFVGVGRATCHKVGYNCVYYDGHVQFFNRGSQIALLDYIVTTAASPQDANFFSTKNVFDLDEGTAD